MAKASGLGDTLLVGGYNLSGDVGEVSRVGSSSGVLVVTGIDKSAIERILSHTDGAIEFKAFFNDAAGQEHPVLGLPFAGTDVVASYLHGATIGNMAAGIVAKQINYDMTRGDDGSLTEAIQLLANAYGLDFCQQLTAGMRTDTGATNGASLDNAAASALGAVAYLHVTSFTGTSVTVAVQSSSDDGGSDAYSNITALVFTAVSAAPAAERKATAAGASIERYLRVATTGTFNPATFSVIVSRTLYAP